MFCSTGMLTGDTKSMAALLPSGATTQHSWNRRMSLFVSWFPTPPDVTAPPPPPLRRISRLRCLPDSSARKLIVSGTWLASANNWTTTRDSRPNSTATTSRERQVEGKVVTRPVACISGQVVVFKRGMVKTATSQNSDKPENNPEQRPR